MSEQHALLAAIGIAGAGALVWAAGRRGAGANGAAGTVVGTVDCTTPAGSYQPCSTSVELELVGADGSRVAVPLDRGQDTATFAVDVAPGVWTVYGNGSPIYDANDRVVTVTVVAGHTSPPLQLAATPLAHGVS